MKRRSAFGDRHPRWIAGLWFSTILVASRLMFSFAVRAMMSGAGANLGLPDSLTLTDGVLLLIAGCVGARLGPGLLAPGVGPAEVVRRGAWIGLLTGFVFTPLSAFALWVASLGTPRDPAWVGAVLLAIQTFFLAGLLLPIGVVAAWCFVRLGGPTERRPA